MCLPSPPAHPKVSIQSIAQGLSSGFFEGKWPWVMFNDFPAITYRGAQTAFQLPWLCMWILI